LDHGVRSRYKPYDVDLRFSRSGPKYLVWKVVNGQSISNAEATLTYGAQAGGLHVQFRFDDLIPDGSEIFCKRALSTHGALFELDLDRQVSTLGGLVKVAKPDEVAPYPCAFVDTLPE